MYGFCEGKLTVPSELRRGLGHVFATLLLTVRPSSLRGELATPSRGCGRDLEVTALIVTTKIACDRHAEVAAAAITAIIATVVIAVEVTTIAITTEVTTLAITVIAAFTVTTEIPIAIVSPYGNLGDRHYGGSLRLRSRIVTAETGSLVMVLVARISPRPPR